LKDPARGFFILAGKETALTTHFSQAEDKTLKPAILIVPQKF